MSLRQVLRQFKPAPMLPPIAREAIAEPFRQGGRGYARDNWLITHSWGFALEDIIIPVHLWHGESDVMAPIALARYLAAHFPNCRATYYAGERHDLFTLHEREILTTLLAAPGGEGAQTEAAEGVGGQDSALHGTTP